MTTKILYVERKPFDSYSIEKAFRHIAEGLSGDLDTAFQQLPYGNRIWDTMRNLLLFRKQKADIYHLTGQVHYIALRFSRRNTLLSIMDVRFLYIKPGLRRWLLQKLYLDWPLARLDHITAISEQTKAEIIRYTGCDADKIHVLDLPLVVFTDDDPRPFNEKKPTVLQVGTMENKNIPNLARALNGLDCKLRIIGRLTADQVAVLGENKLEYENVFDLSDAEMQDEYRTADLVAFCSTYEGFGMPIIEAQAMQKPVVTSDLSPMVETSGGAAVLVDPHDISSIRAGIKKVIDDAGFRQKLVAAGLENIERFTPERVAVGYEKLYKTILEKDKAAVKA